MLLLRFSKHIHQYIHTLCTVYHTAHESKPFGSAKYFCDQILSFCIFLQPCWGVSLSCCHNFVELCRPLSSWLILFIFLPLLTAVSKPIYFCFILPCYTILCYAILLFILLCCHVIMLSYYDVITCYHVLWYLTMLPCVKLLPPSVVLLLCNAFFLCFLVLNTSFLPSSLLP